MADDTSNLLSLLSHELRGPLGVVRGYLRLITQSNEPLSERSKVAIDAALKASDRLASILDEASLLAHLRLGDVVLESKRLPLSSLLNAAVQASELPEGSTVTLDVAPVMTAALSADEARLRAALATLITAVARAQSRAVTVELSATPSRLGGKPAVRLRIGPKTVSGVEATESDLNEKRGGFGLAIPIAATTIAAHGGRVRELHQGDRTAGLVVTLPLL